MFSYLLPIPSPPLIWASGNSGFRNSVVKVSCPVPRPSRYGTGRNEITTRAEKGDIEDNRKHILRLPEIDSLEDIVHCFPLIELHILAYSSLKRHIHKPAVLFRPFRTFPSYRIFVHAVRKASYAVPGARNPAFPWPFGGLDDGSTPPSGGKYSMSAADGEAEDDDEKQRPVGVGETLYFGHCLVDTHVALAKRRPASTSRS